MENNFAKNYNTAELEHKLPVYLQYIVCILAFLIPLLQVIRLPLSFLTGLPLQSFAFIPVALLAGIGLYLELKNKKIIRNVRLLWLFFLWLAYASVSTIWSPDKLRGIMFIGTLLCGFGCIGVFRNSVLKEKVFTGFVAGMTIINLFLISLYVSDNVENIIFVGIRYANILYTLSYTFLNPNAWGFYQLLAIVIIIYRIGSREAGFHIYLSLGFHTWMLWLTQSRSAVLALTGVFILSLFLLKKRKAILVGASLFFLTLCISTLLTILVSAPLNLSAPRRGMGGNRILSNGFVYETDTNIRLVIWSSAIKELMQEPARIIFGAGNGGAQVFSWHAILEHHGSVDLTWIRGEPEGAISPHNTYVEFIVDYGVIGFLLFCGFFISVAVALWKKNKTILLFAAPSVIGGVAGSYHTLAPFIIALSIILADFVTEQENDEAELKNT